MTEIIVRLSAEHPHADLLKVFGGKIKLKAESYDHAYLFAITILNLQDDDSGRFEHGDLMFFNEGILIEIDR